MKLADLLRESQAAEKARQMGLKPAGYGRYMNQQGVIVARIEGDELVTVSPKEDIAKNQEKTQKDIEKAKPTGTSAKAAGQAPTSGPGASDIQKMNGTSKPKENSAGGMGGGGPEAPPNTFHPMRPAPLTMGKIVFDGDVRAALRQQGLKFSGDTTRHPVLEELVIGEEVRILTPDERDTFLDASWEEENGLKNEDEVAEVALQSAMSQDQEFRQALPDKHYDTLWKTQFWWQQMAKHRRPKQDRVTANNNINTICNQYRPKLKIQQPLERGMQIPISQLKMFLNDFQIGENIDLPPSGFSVRPSVARQYAYPSEDSVSVLVRLAPDRKGNIHGLSLFGAKVKPGFEELQAYHSHPDNDFEYEAEVIRYSGPKARCTNVTKMITPGESVWSERGKILYTMYVIDLEEVGYDEGDRDIPTNEAIDLETGSTNNPIFDKYMNTSLQAAKSPRHAVDASFKKLVNANDSTV